jgi:hypothetical protein
MAIERSTRPIAKARLATLARRLLDASTLCAIATVSPGSRAHVNTAYFAWSDGFATSSGSRSRVRSIHATSAPARPSRSPSMTRTSRGASRTVESNCSAPHARWRAPPLATPSAPMRSVFPTTASRSSAPTVSTALPPGIASPRRRFCGVASISCAYRLRHTSPRAERRTR